MDACVNVGATEECARNDQDKVERCLRDKLKRWQALQVAGSALDNIVNKVLENMMLPSDLLERRPDFNSVALASRLCMIGRNYMKVFGVPWCRGDYMEDRAVTMAISNHGLVKSAKLISQSHDDKASPSCRADSEHIGVHCSSPSGCAQDAGPPAAIPTTSSDLPGLINSIETGRCDMSDSDADKVYDSDQPEDFLERAVAEAIKKKGLSALSVKDY